MRAVLRTVVVLAGLSVACSRSAPRAGDGGWNEAQIEWTAWPEALARARAESKPVCLIFFTGWCPHCKAYEKLFFDPRVAEKARGLVMVRVDDDHSGALGNQYALDGHYIPRTYFLSAEGAVLPGITSGNPRYKYFYDERDAAGLLASMVQAVAQTP